MKKTARFPGCCLFLFFVLDFFLEHFAFAQSPGQAGLIEGAKKEGKVTWYATLNINDSNALLSRFEQKYPFIKTELLRAGTEQLLNRIITEENAGRSALDLVNLTTINALKRRGLLQVHHSQEFSAYPQQFKDPEGYWATVYNIYYVIGYNPKMVSPKDAPKNWDDFLAQVERENRHGSGGIRVVCGNPQLLGERKGAKIPWRFGEAGHSLEPRPYDDRATDGGR
jgi:spermidine/putrescine-binding protein